MPDREASPKSDGKASTYDTAHIRLVDGQAAVQIGGRSIRVSRRDIPGEPYHCPVELVAAALGS